LSIVVIGLNHRTVPLELLERTTVTAAALPKALHDLISRPNINEVVLLSTCNRTEVYAVAERFHPAYADIRDFLCDLATMAPEDLQPHLYSQHDVATVAHLFSVAAGLESAVLSEHEILDQVRSAWSVAQDEGTARSSLNQLFRHALETGKRARTETAIARGTASVSHAAVEMASDRLGSLEGRRVLILGAGDMAEGMASALQGAGVDQVLVANRTWRKARALADRIGGQAVRLSDLSLALLEIDVLLTSTGSQVPVVEHDDFAPVVTERRGRPLLIVDIAVPRDVDPSVHDLPGVTLLDINDLRRFAQAGIDRRANEVAAVHGIVSDEVDRFTSVASARSAAPLIGALHQRAEQLRQTELTRHASKLATLDPQQQDAVDALTRGILAKVLHQPSIVLKAQAGTPTGDRLAEALRQLYDLDGSTEA